MYALIFHMLLVLSVVTWLIQEKNIGNQWNWLCVIWRLLQNVGLVFDKNIAKHSNVVGYVNSNYVGDPNKWRFSSGSIFVLCNFTISWKVSLQSIVVLSITKAKYISAIEGIKEAIWLRVLVNDLGLLQKVTTIFCDSQSAIHLIKN